MWRKPNKTNKPKQSKTKPHHWWFWELYEFQKGHKEEYNLMAHDLTCPWTTLEKKKDVDGVVKRKEMRKKAEKTIHTGRSQEEWSNTRELFSHFLSRQRDSNNFQKDMTPPWDAISVTAYLHNCNFSHNFFTSGKMAWKGGSLLLQASCAPQKKKHHAESRKVTFKVHNKHDCNLPLRCLPTSPPTWKMYLPFEMKFPW